MPHPPRHTASLPWHQRIGHRIVAVAVLAAFVPIMILGLTIGVKFRRDLVQQAINAQLGLTGAIQNGIDSLLRSYERQLSALATDPDVQQMEDAGTPGRVADRQREAMYRFLDINPVFYSCFIYAADGTVTSIAFRNRYRGQDERFIGKNLLRTKGKGMESTREAFLQVLQSGLPSFTGHIISSSDQKMMLMMVPVRDFVDTARCIGVISCAINLEGPEMKELIREYPLQGGDILQLVDQTGRMIAWRGDGLPDGLVGVSLDFDRLQAQSTQPVEFAVGDRPYLGIVTRLPALNSYLIAAKPRGEILGFLHRILFDLALVLGIAFVLAIGFGYAISRPLAANVDRLLEGIRRVSDGVVSHRVVVEGQDEMAQACAAFNDMVATLEKNRLMDEVWTREWERK
ncbi:MAG: HAMP domain-containing protein [Candidatus Riflebacteria bacterium]|nr:HAMP domain-containing protein [Candidatus Riflebacteria bacterium]